MYTFTLAMLHEIMYNSNLDVASSSIESRYDNAKCVSRFQDLFSDLVSFRIRRRFDLSRISRRPRVFVRLDLDRAWCVGTFVNLSRDTSDIPWRARLPSKLRSYATMRVDWLITRYIRSKSVKGRFCAHPRAAEERQSEHKSHWYN